jgi:Na+/melibiose symporter-like transporter
MAETSTAPDQRSVSLPRVTAATRLSYGAGAAANGIKNTAFNTYLLLYFNQVLGVPAAIVSTALALTLIIDALADPLIGRVSDVTRSRWGRRHPFIYASAVPTALFFGLVWFVPEGFSNFETGVWIFCIASLARVSISAFEIPTSAMASELTQDYTERTRLFAMRWWFGYAGAFGFAAFSLAVFFAATLDYPRGQLNPDGYVWFALTGAVLIFVAMVVCGLGTHNRIPHLRQAGAREVPMPLTQHFSEMFTAFSNRGFLAIFGFGVFKYTAIGLYSATTLYFGTYLFKLDGRQLALLTFDSLVAATLAAPLAPIFARKLGKRNTSIIMAIAGVSLGLSPLLLSYLDLFYRPGDPRLVPTLFVIGAVYGAMVAISLINTSSMLADVVEDNAVNTGQHSAGVFFAASSFMQQCSAGLGIFAAGMILTWSQFPAKLDPARVTEAMTDSLLIHYIPTVLMLWGVGCLILLFYPIDRARHEANVERLRAEEAEANANMIRDAAHGAPVL